MASPSRMLKASLGGARDMVAGHDCAAVVTAYARGCEGSDVDLQAAALQWLRGMYGTRFPEIAITNRTNYGLITARVVPIKL